jgi:GAF domain-containing protein
MALYPDQPKSGMDSRVFDALGSLNQIGIAINRLGSSEDVKLSDVLQLIVESATQLIPGSAAILFALNENERTFDLSSRVSAGDWMPPVIGDEPRPNGLGMHAIQRGRKVLSYEEPGIDIHPLKYSAGARSMVCCPLIVTDVPVGILYVYLNEERHFNVMELLLLDNFVNQAAMALAQTRRLQNVRRDLARKEDELNKLRRAGLLISSRLKLDETLDAILQMALEVTGAKYGILRLVDKGNQNLVMRALAGEELSRPLIETLPIESNSVMAWVARHRKPVCIGDLTQEGWSEIYYPLDAQMKMHSELAVPIIGASGRLEGVLNLESPEFHAFSEQDSHLLQSFATQAVIAIQEARLLDALHEITEMLLSQPQQQVVNRLVDLACELLNAVSSAIWVLEGDRLVLQATSSGLPHAHSVPLYQSLIGQAVLTRGAVSAENDSAEFLENNADIDQVETWTRVLAVPLLSGSKREPVGAFSIYGSSIGITSNSDWDKKVLNSLSHYAALAVHRDTNERALKEAHEKRAVAEAFAAVGDISANLLHHLNNKVGTIPVRVQGIQEKCKDILEAESYLAKNLGEIEQSARQAMIVMRESLAYLNPIRLAAVDIESCVKDAIDEAHLPPEVSIHLIGLSHLPSVVAGRKGLVLVFYNLLQNAVEAMKGEGFVTIHGMVRNEWVEVAVSDSGPGIAPDLHDRIFDFNYSGRSDAKLGFGLWWVKTWMTRMGGMVFVDSEGHSGATFRLRMPFARDGE